MKEKHLPDPETGRFFGEVVRIVESQEQVATTRIVKNLEEQGLLETMLEGTKPGSIAPDLHYLLSTPFRYPPLRHGSRFGSYLEPGIFYASLELETCLQECAYYRFLFWHDMEVEPPSAVKTQHTLFRVDLASNACIDLWSTKYDEFRQEISSTTNYDFTQKLGSQLRDMGVEMVVFESARGPGSNVAVYTPEVFVGNPREQELWNSEVNSELVLLRGPGDLFKFPITRFSNEAGQLMRVMSQ